MKELHEQLAHSYHRELELYGEVLELVRRQDALMAASPDPGAVLALCREVEALMGQIAAIEESTAPARQRWGQRRHDPRGELGDVLARIEELIQEVGRVQEAVQQRLLAYMQSQKEATDRAQASIKAGRARRLYRAG